ERLEAKNLFESKEVIEEAQRVPAKAVSPVETPDVSDATAEQQIPKATAPTPEQIIAIKVQ
ncbi:U2 small nuclear ribonucleoprotein A, partial [Trifolium medium]|nr:U2 small nuclear ribonucleoprotein A [Trifolium medium]